MKSGSNGGTGTVIGVGLGKGVPSNEVCTRSSTVLNPNFRFREGVAPEDKEEKEEKSFPLLSHFCFRKGVAPEVEEEEEEKSFPSSSNKITSCKDSLFSFISRVDFGSFLMVTSLLLAKFIAQSNTSGP